MLRTSESPRLAASATWQAILGRFATVGLADMAETAVASRIDTKFVLLADDLLPVVDALEHRYRILDIDGSRFTGYRTQYFDTESCALFRRHHAGGGNRCKVRTRHYANTGLAFLEVKRKARMGVTTKARSSLPHFETEGLRDHAAFVDAQCPYAASDLVPMLRNRFDRITLLSSEQHERLTIDLDLAVERPDGDLPLPRIAVAELKQDRVAPGWRDSAFLSAMRAMGMRPTGFSKYCIGLLLSRPGIKHNLFKPQLKQLRRLMGESNAVA